MRHEKMEISFGLGDSYIKASGYHPIRTTFRTAEISRGNYHLSFTSYYSCVILFPFLLRLFLAAMKAFVAALIFEAPLSSSMNH